MSNGQIRGDSYSTGCLGQTGKLAVVEVEKDMGASVVNAHLLGTHFSYNEK